jgi:MFS family permease
MCILDTVRYPRETLIDWSNPYSLNNWVNQIDLYCASSFEIGLFGSMFFFGYLISCVVFPPLADVYGRKPFVIAVCIMHTLCFFSFLFIPSIASFYATIFVFGAMGPLKNMIAYTHLMEFLPSKVSEISGFIFFMDDFLQVICPLVLMYLTTNTNIFLWAGVA